VTSSADNRPERMFRQARPVDSCFESSEDLYYRCRAEHISDNRLLPQAIRFPDFSVNRSKYSNPEDVLVPTYSDWGVSAFHVGDLQLEQKTDAHTVYSWQVIHDPLEDNYSHSEVRTFKNGSYSETLKVPTTTKKFWLSQNCREASPDLVITD
jgi:hypothetical protein